MNDASLYRYSLLSILCALPACSFFSQQPPEMSITMIHHAQDIPGIFPTSPAAITALANTAIREAQEAVEHIIALDDRDRTFKNTAKALDEAIMRFDSAGSTIASIGMLNPDKAMREEAHKQEVIISQKAIDLFGQNKALYEAFKAYALGNSKKESLTAEERYFINEAMDDFKRAGLELSDAQREKVKELQKKLAELTTEFDKNINQDSTTITATREELEGVKEDFINSLKKDESGNYILRTDYPTRSAVMPNARHESLRKRFHQAMSNRAYPTNLEVLNKIIGTRDELAHALGFSSYAALDLSNQMVKTPQNAREFLDELMIKARKKGELEYAMLTKELPEGVCLTEDKKIKPWDSSYITEQYRQKHYNISQEKLSEYFPMESTIKALFAIYEKFFGITFTVTPLHGLWHDDIELIQVDKDGKTVGFIIIDLYPRDNKYSHACHMGIYPATVDEHGTLLPSVGIVVANFPKSTGNKPALLKFSDVITFFHEFGHALHAVLGRTALATQAGTSVKRDFVELPSQMLEEWLYEPEILNLVSCHYQTGEPLPADTIKKLIELKRLTSGIGVLGQGTYAREV